MDLVEEVEDLSIWLGSGLTLLINMSTNLLMKKERKKEKDKKKLRLKEDAHIKDGETMISVERDKIGEKRELP